MNQRINEMYLTLLLLFLSVNIAPLCIFLAPSPTPPPTTLLRGRERWTKNRHYLRLDGSTSAMDREKMINKFNSPTNEHCWLFLISTRAGSLGINLIGMRLSLDEPLAGPGCRRMS